MLGKQSLHLRLQTFNHLMTNARNLFSYLFVIFLTIPLRKWILKSLFDNQAAIFSGFFLDQAER